MISSFARGCISKCVALRVPMASNTRTGSFQSSSTAHIFTQRQHFVGHTGMSMYPGQSGLSVARRLGHRFLSAIQGDDDGAAPLTDETSVDAEDESSLVQRLVESFPAFLGDLQAAGALDMDEAAEAPSKLEDRAQVKQSVLEFCRSRPDILASLTTSRIGPLANYEQDEPNKKLRSALRRVRASYLLGESLGPSDGGPANFQDVVRIIMEMSFADAEHMTSIPDETVQAALDLLPEILEFASTPADSETLARAVEEDKRRSGVPNPDKGKKDKRRERNASGDEDDPWAEFGSDTRRSDQSESDWECSDCGQSNFARRTRCYGCGAARSMVDAGYSDPFGSTKEVKDGDWICIECDSHNFSRRRTCFSCGIPRSKGDANYNPESQQRSAKPGEWICTECGINNFFYREECYRCDTPRSELAEVVEAKDNRRQPSGRGNRQTDMRPGDWECPDCGAHNFARNSFCFRCDADRPEGAGAGPMDGAARGARNMRPGDWECPDCGAHNFARNRECFKCDADRPEGAGASFNDGAARGARNMRPGDWECPDCGAHNFARNRACFKCDADRPAGTEGFQGGDFKSQGIEMRPGDWECPDCGAHNFARNMECFKCDADRPGNAPMSKEEQSKYGGQARRGNWKCHECGFNNKAHDKYCQRCDTPAGSSDGGSFGWFEG